MSVITRKIDNNPSIVADDILLFDANAGVGSYANTLSGSFTYPSGDKPCSIMINKGKDIFSSACHSWLGFPESVIYRYKDGTFGIGKFKSTSEIPNRANVLWAIGGLGLLDKYNPAEEGFSKGVKPNGTTFDYTDVLRYTNHTILGIKNNQCYLIYVKLKTGAQVNAFARWCDFEYAIMLDGGHIAAINGSESYAKINLSTKQGYTIQGINGNFATGTPPVVTPTTPPTNSSKKKIAIDSGHSKVTYGKRSFDGTLLEYEFNFDVSTRLKRHLDRHNTESKIFQVENTNVSTEITERCKQINAYEPDICISIHANAFSTSWNTVGGWEIFDYKLSGESHKLAEAIYSTSIPFLKLADRGIKDGSHLGMIASTTMPAVLVEHGFYTNKEECARLKTAAFREDCAIADAKGILKYFGIAWIEEKIEIPTSTPTPSDSLYRIQVGVFSTQDRASKLRTELRVLGYPSLLTIVDNLFKVQVGAFHSIENAKGLQAELLAKGYNTIIQKD